MAKFELTIGELSQENMDLKVRHEMSYDELEGFGSSDESSEQNGPAAWQSTQVHWMKS